MADPSRLIESATRIYGDRMEHFWGEFAPVPTSNLVPLTGGERIEAGGRTFDVAYTPGHASHHVSFFDASSGVAFVGDTAGGVLVGEFEGFRSKPLHTDDGHEAIEQNAAHRGIGLQSFEAAHR